MTVKPLNLAKLGGCPASKRKEVRLRAKLALLLIVFISASFERRACKYETVSVSICAGNKSAIIKLLKKKVRE
jgi:hypothetical protein